MNQQPKWTPDNNRELKFRAIMPLEMCFKLLPCWEKSPLGAGIVQQLETILQACQLPGSYKLPSLWGSSVEEVPG
jgi:hypothetical protein